MAKKGTSKPIPSPPGDDATPEELSAYFEKYGLQELEKAGFVEELTAEEARNQDELSNFLRSRVEVRKARTQLNLAMSVEQLERFIKFANKKHIPPSTLAKAWILERLDQETERA